MTTLSISQLSFGVLNTELDDGSIIPNRPQYNRWNIQFGLYSGNIVMDGDLWIHGDFVTITNADRSFGTVQFTNFYNLYLRNGIGENSLPILELNAGEAILIHTQEILR